MDYRPFSGSQRSGFGASNRPKSAIGLTSSRQMMIGQGGVTSSLARQKSKKLPPPPKTKAFKAQEHIVATLFRKYYLRGDLPIIVNFQGAKRKLTWRVSPDLLDFSHYLPIFFDGLREVQEPFVFIADQGCEEMLSQGQHKVLPVLPQLILPLKAALSTKRIDVVIRAIKKLQKLALVGPLVAEALVPYFRQLLPVLNLFRSKRLSTFDKFEYGQYKNENVEDLVQETLEILEKNGGEDAYINIKYMVPTYESCMF